MMSGGEVGTIFGFEKENDSLQWIKEKSQGMVDRAEVAQGDVRRTPAKPLIGFGLKSCSIRSTSASISSGAKCFV
jgi:hypothetical protein